MTAQLVERDAVTWAQFLRDFDGAHKTFLENRQALIAVGPYVRTNHPDMVPQYEALLARANDLAPRLAQLAGIKGTVAGWLESLGSGISRLYQGAVDATSQAIERIAGGISAARRMLGLGAYDEGLGAAPILVPVAAATAAALVVATTKWVADAYLFARRVNALQELQAKGMSASEAAQALNRVLGDPAAPGGIERTLRQVVWVLALGGGLWLMATLFRGDSGGRR